MRGAIVGWGRDVEWAGVFEGTGAKRVDLLLMLSNVNVIGSKRWRGGILLRLVKHRRGTPYWVPRWCSRRGEVGC